MIKHNEIKSDNTLVVLGLAIIAVLGLAIILSMLNDESGKVVSDLGSDVLEDEDAMRKVNDSLAPTQEGEPEHSGKNQQPVTRHSEVLVNLD